MKKICNMQKKKPIFLSPLKTSFHKCAEKRLLLHHHLLTIKEKKGATRATLARKHLIIKQNWVHDLVKNVHPSCTNGATEKGYFFYFAYTRKVFCVYVKGLLGIRKRLFKGLLTPATIGVCTCFTVILPL